MTMSGVRTLFDTDTIVDLFPNIAPGLFSCANIVHDPYFDSAQGNIQRNRGSWMAFRKK